jgi:formyltetrahydrofolate hydrolase
MWLGGTGPSFTDQKRFDATNRQYRQAVSEGLQPAGVSAHAVNAAYDAAS